MKGLWFRQVCGDTSTKKRVRTTALRSVRGSFNFACLCSSTEDIFDSISTTAEGGVTWGSLEKKEPRAWVCVWEARGWDVIDEVKVNMLMRFTVRVVALQRHQHLLTRELICFQGGPAGRGGQPSGWGFLVDWCGTRSLGHLRWKCDERSNEYEKTTRLILASQM